MATTGAKRPAVRGVLDAQLEMLLDELPDDQRDAFVLRQFMGYRYDEAASMCECPVGTIRSRVARARAALADMVNHPAEHAG